jgi:cysteine desulfurase / selenocysteine lyase
VKEIYLDNAATSWPKPGSVIKAMNNYFYKIGGSSGRSGHRRAIEAGRLIMNARTAAAELLGVSDDSGLIFTSNATTALNLVISGIFFSDKQINSSHIVTTSMEHNSVLRPVNLLKEKGLDVTLVKADIYGQVSPKQIEAAIKSNTKLVVVTHASNVCGTVNNIDLIGKICSDKNVPLLVDGAQSAGTLPINLDSFDIDFFACAGHKGLLGPQGTGLLYVKNKDLLSPSIAGGTGSLSDSAYQPDFMPDKFESGTPNIIGIAGLAEGCRYLLNHGVESIYEHDKKLLGIFLNELSGIRGIQLYGLETADNHTAVLSVNIDGMDSSQLGTVLEEKYGIQTRIGLHCAPLAHKTLNTFPHGTVRFSWGWATREREIVKAAATLNKINSGLRSGV